MDDNAVREADPPPDQAVPTHAASRASRRPFGVFISYRRDDSAGHTGRLFDKLVGRLGRGRVFMDINAIQPGMDFRNAIDKALGNSSVVLAIIGRSWLEARDPDGKRRLESPTDLVRLEIASALRQGMDVIPVLVQRASMPPAELLPDDIRGLAWRHAIEIDDSRWDQDVERLVTGIDRTRAAGPSGRGSRPVGRLAALGLVAAVAAVAVVAGGAILLATQQSPSGPVAGGSASPSAGNSSPTPTSASSSPLPTAPPTFETILETNALDGPVPGLSASRTESCQIDTVAGLSITAQKSNFICYASTAAMDPGIVSLQDVRVDVDASFTKIVKSDFPYGPGDAGVACRSIGPLWSGDFYIASLSPSGYWTIDRFVKGKQNQLEWRIDPALVTPIGRTRHLQLTCAGSADGTTTLSFSIDSEPVATVLDPLGLAPGSVALAATPYVQGAIAVSFRNLEIRGP